MSWKNRRDLLLEFLTEIREERMRYSGRSPDLLIGKKQRNLSNFWRDVVIAPHHGSVRKKQVVLPPGHLLLSLAGFVYSTRNFERRFEPVIADMRKEYLEALQEQRPWKARWTLARGYLSFASAMGLHGFVSLLGKIIASFKLG